MRQVNVDEMKKSGKVVLLTASPETILEHRNTTATRYDHVLLGTALAQKFRLLIAEIFFSVQLKDLGNAHAVTLCDDLVHFDNIHGKGTLQSLGYGTHCH